MKKIAKKDAILAWHWISASRQLEFGDDRVVYVGETLSIKGKPKLCTWGMHASVKAIDSLGFRNEVICRVKLWGKVDVGYDKIAAKHRHCIWLADIGNTLSLFNLCCCKKIIKRCEHVTKGQRKRVLKDLAEFKKTVKAGQQLEGFPLTISRQKWSLPCDCIEAMESILVDDIVPEELSNRWMNKKLTKMLMKLAPK